MNSLRAPRLLIDRLLFRLRRMASARGHGSVAQPSLQSRRMVAEPWLIDSVEVLQDAGQVRLRGWALPDPDRPQEEWAKRFLVNGKAPEMVEYPLPRPDVQQVFWHRENATLSGFVLVAKAEYPQGVMKVTCLDSACTGPDRDRQNWYLPEPGLHQDLPDPDRRFRVIGNREAEGFLLWGASDAYRIKAAYEAVTGKTWNQIGAVLDWGAGCGRVARHLAPALGERFFGCDIDSDNVSWCAAHLPGTYKTSRLQPPLPFADNSFDVVYGVSVFTHLRAQWEAKWLSELHRVLRPGGTMLVTVHGQTAIDFAALDAFNYRALLRRVDQEGLVVTSSNNQLDGFVEHPEEYVNVFHSCAHIDKVWSRMFKDIKQLKGYVFTHDLVVATKK